MEHFFRLLQLLVGLLFVLFLAYMTTRILGAKTSSLGQGKYMKIIDRIMLGSNKYLCIVQVGSLFYVVAVTANQVEYLGTLSEETLIPLKEEVPKPFTNILDKYMRSHKVSPYHQDTTELPIYFRTLNGMMNRNQASLRKRRSIRDSQEEMNGEVNE